MVHISVESGSNGSTFSPKFKSPDVLEEIQALTGLVRGITETVDSINQRLGAVEAALLSRPQMVIHFVFVYCYCVIVILKKGIVHTTYCRSVDTAAR